MLASEFLQLRRDELAFSDNDHWVNHAPRKPHEMCIVVGARYEQTIEVVNALMSGDSGPMVLARNLLDRLAIQKIGWSATSWNDRPERTLSEVLDLFDEAIVMAKEEEASSG